MKTWISSTCWLLWTNAAINLDTSISFEFVLSIPLSTYPAVELLDHMVILSVIFWGTALLFSIVTAPFCMEYFILSFEGKRKLKTEAQFSCRKTKTITFVFHTCVCWLKTCIPAVLVWIRILLSPSWGLNSTTCPYFFLICRVPKEDDLHGFLPLHPAS